MAIAFFGLANSFDYHHIGGTDAIARRLSISLNDLGREVSFVHFGAETAHVETTPEGISLRYFRTLAESLDALATDYSDVMTFYVPPHLRARYAYFRQQLGTKIRFHRFFFGWPESKLKRELLMLDARIAPYNGQLLTISPRQYHQVAQWSSRTVLLLPPVPDSFFLKPNDKMYDSNDLRVTYMGRVDPGKGTDIAYNAFRKLQQHSGFRTKICGYPWAHDPASWQLHTELASQDEVFYEQAQFQVHPPAVEESVGRILGDTDVLFLPYTKLSSTIDTPLVLLEGMAHLCAVVTCPLGSLPDVYGTNRWMVRDLSDLSQVEACMLDLRENLDAERDRLLRRNEELGYSTSAAAERLCQILGK